MLEKIALLYSDGSMGVYDEKTEMAQIEGDRREADKNETERAHMTKIVRVGVEVLEILFDPTGLSDAEVEKCYSCNEDVDRKWKFCPRCGAKDRSAKLKAA